MTAAERKVLTLARKYAEARVARRRLGDAQLPWSQWSAAQDRLNEACDALLVASVSVRKRK